MVRDKNLLSDKDLFRNTADIIESAKDCKIHLHNTTRNSSYVESYHGEDYDGKTVDEHNIMVGCIKGVEKFTILNHELGHVMFDSPIVSAKEMIKGWAIDFPKKYERAVIKTYWGALNTIEDQRVESLMAKIWLNNAVRFTKARQNLGKNMAETMANIDATLQGKGYNPNQQINPIQCMLAVRFFRDDIAKMSPAHGKAKEVLDKVEGTGQTGSLIGLRMIKNEIDRYIKDMVEMCDKKARAEEEMQQKIKDYEDSCKAQGKSPLPSTMDSLFNKLGSETTAKDEAKSDWDKQLNGLPDTSNQFKEKNKIAEQSIPEACKPENTSAWTSPEEDKKIEEDLNKSLIDAKDEGVKEIEAIKATLLQDTGSAAWAENVEEDSDSRDVVKCGLPAEELAKGMNKLFKKIQGLPKQVVGYEGSDVDIESYIQNKSRGYDLGECMIDTRYVGGASVLISVDGSSSMDNHANSMEKARNMVATLYKSIEGVPHIHLEAIVWSGSSANDSMEVTHVKSLKDTVRMGTHDGYPLTPTHLAIQYSGNMIRAMPGRKKLLIIITDGYPQFVKNNTELSTDVLCQMAHKEMLKALRKCPNIVGMLITPSSQAKDYCKTIFGKRFLVVENMNEGAKVITKQFQKIVAGVLGR
jgi:hypothetical protein